MRSMSLSIFNLESQYMIPDPTAVRDAKDGTGKKYFDKTATLTKLEQSFPSIIINEEDPLLAEAKRSEAFFADKETPQSKAVVASLYEKAKNFGPATSFSIPVGQAHHITGVIRRYDIRFIYPEDIPSLDLIAILKFLQSFGVGDIVDCLWFERRQNE